MQDRLFGSQEGGDRQQSESVVAAARTTNSYRLLEFQKEFRWAARSRFHSLRFGGASHEVLLKRLPNPYENDEEPLTKLRHPANVNIAARAVPSEMQNPPLFSEGTHLVVSALFDRTDFGRFSDRHSPERL
jgi:hypothetical protein